MAEPPIYALKHDTLNTTLRFGKSNLTGAVISHYHGIPYGSISERFAAPQAIPSPPSSQTNTEIDCTRYGPRCPQPKVDIGHLLRLPDELTSRTCAVVEEDEFGCLNLDVVVPDTRVEGKKLPVLIWIHGGSQVVTFASAASGCCDPTKLVSDSAKQGKPFVFVGINYRLNIFAFGDGKGELNLALQDQKLAIEWVQHHVAGFGGDPHNITLAGESAGAVYVHAHTLTGAGVKRAILSSGSLYLSPPLPAEKGKAMSDMLEGEVQRTCGKSLRDAPAAKLVEALEAKGVVSMWIQEDEALKGWSDREEEVKELLIGDVEYESVIWRNGIETMSGEQIRHCFDDNLKPDDAKLLCKLYCINPTRPTSCKLGALDYIQDVRFSLPVDDIAARWRMARKEVYQYVVDQTNPWQASNRAHHAVDLILLFGGYESYDMGFSPAAKAVGAEMRRRWIQFVNGDAPWDQSKRYGFGPHGKSGEIEDEEFSARRRKRHFDVLRKISLGDLNKVVGALAAGRISLLN